MGENQIPVFGPLSSLTVPEVKKWRNFGILESFLNKNRLPNYCINVTRCGKGLLVCDDVLGVEIASTAVLVRYNFNSPHESESRTYLNL